MEACKHPAEALKQIRSLGAKAGVVINPETPVETLSDILAETDMVLLMSVHPGFGGQSFIPDTIGKILTLKQMIRSINLPILIEVDGGIDLRNAGEVLRAGADILVAGNTIFKSSDPMATILRLKNIC
jgi:ribulose-phosphate 3-epimerase